MSRTIRALAALSIVAIAITGCSKKNNNANPSDQPTGPQLMAEGDKAMSDVKSAHFTLTVDGKIAALPVKQAEGDLTREGSAKGTAKVEQLGFVTEVAFVIVGQDLFLKGPTGGYQKMPLSVAASVYDPSAILDPDRGAAKLLRTAKNPKFEGKEQVDGKQACKVSFEPDTTALAALIPTTITGIKGMVWLYEDSKRIAKAEFTFPEGGKVTVVFTNYDAPVTISAP
ncbi:LppX_LprAFG lipoprotein [Allorhizocola rhizosphaerae]|uniref:LppX_LprAFG lipoprotein n=1 Tax=Allorhizocola rhizosphaerae TaxID=1872709 RepID=UPI0013C34700|nr:LppX_LprAFG lipoprotein [Allorhizocola rhizosphaerae]